MEKGKAEARFEKVAKDVLERAKESINREAEGALNDIENIKEQIKDSMKELKALSMMDMGNSIFAKTLPIGDYPNNEYYIVRHSRLEIHIRNAPIHHIIPMDENKKYVMKIIIIEEDEETESNGIAEEEGRV